MRPEVIYLKVIWEKDLAAESPVPWYLPLDKTHFSLTSFRLTAIGRLITKNMVRFIYGELLAFGVLQFEH